MSGEVRTNWLSDAMASVLSSELSTLLWTTDRHLRITSCLGQAISSGDVSSEELLNRTVGECFGIDYPEAPIIAAHRHALLGEAISCDLAWREKTLQAFVVPHRDGSRRVIGCSGIAREVTDRDQEAAELYRLFNLSMQMLCIAGSDGYFKRVNPAFEKTLGYRPNEMLNRPFLDFVHPEDREATVRQMKALAKGQPTLQFENRYRCSDGSYRWLSWTSSPQSKAGVLYATAFDITERKRAEGLFRALLESAPDAVIVVDGGGQIVLVNTTAERVFGYRRSEMIGKPIELLIPRRHRHRHDEFRTRYLSKPKWKDMGGGRCLSACRKDNTEFPVEVRLSPVEVEGSKLIFAAVRDVSEREQLRERIRENEMQLMAAHKIQQYLLPQETPQIDGIDVAGVVLPANYAAGDQYDYLEMGKNKLGIVIGDVSGHGFSSALVMASTHELLRAGANLSGDIGEVITHTNEALCREVEESFVTIVLACIEIAERKLTYVNAGHPPGLLFDRDGNVKHQLHSSALPLAVLDDESFPVSDPVNLEVGDVLVLMTDGVLEAGAPSQNQFGLDRAVEVARANLQRSSQQIVEGLCDAVRDFCGDDKLEDDVTVVVVKFNSFIGDPKLAPE
jgi:PAS domain S-box-containing protein